MKQHTGCPPDRPDRDKTPSAPPEPAHAEAKKTSSRIKRIFSLFKRKKPQPPAPETAAPPCPKPPSAEEISEMPARFERLMTSQLVALWLDSNQEDYKNEYLRRMRMCGLSEAVAEEMLAYETEILQAHPRPELLDENFLTTPLLSLGERFLKHPISYYKTHIEYPLSYVVKLSDEAERYFWFYHERNLDDGVWEEIFALSDRNRALFLPIALDLVNHHGWTVKNMNRFSYNEQGLLDRYRWRRSLSAAAKTPWTVSPPPAKTPRVRNENPAAKKAPSSAGTHAAAQKRVATPQKRVVTPQKSVAAPQKSVATPPDPKKDDEHIGVLPTENPSNGKYHVLDALNSRKADLVCIRCGMNLDGIRAQADGDYCASCREKTKRGEPCTTCSGTEPVFLAAVSASSPRIPKEAWGKEYSRGEKKLLDGETWKTYFFWVERLINNRNIYDEENVYQRSNHETGDCDLCRLGCIYDPDADALSYFVSFLHLERRYYRSIWGPFFDYEDYDYLVELEDERFRIDASTFAALCRLNGNDFFDGLTEENWQDYFDTIHMELKK